MPANAKKMSVLSFAIGESWFAVPLDAVEGIASLPEVIEVPGNNSRIFIGLAYILGQTMSVIDCAPLFNLPSSAPRHQVLIIQFEKEYYALTVNRVGEIVSQPRVEAQKHANGSTRGSFEEKGMSMQLIDTEQLIRQYVCN